MLYPVPRALLKSSSWDADKQTQVVALATSGRVQLLAPLTGLVIGSSDRDIQWQSNDGSVKVAFFALDQVILPGTPGSAIAEGTPFALARLAFRWQLIRDGVPIDPGAQAFTFADPPKPRGGFWPLPQKFFKADKLTAPGELLVFVQKSKAPVRVVAPVTGTVAAVDRGKAGSLVIDSLIGERVTLAGLASIAPSLTKGHPVQAGQDIGTEEGDFVLSLTVDGVPVDPAKWGEVQGWLWPEPGTIAAISFGAVLGLLAAIFVIAGRGRG